MSAQFLRDQCEDKLEPNLLELIDIMTTSTDRMQKMIDSLLAYSRVGRQEQNFREICLEEMIDDLMIMLEGAMDEVGGQVRVISLPKVRGDEYLLVQLFQNLIENAVKYRKDGVPPEIVIEGRELPGNYEITVTDNGQGIGSEYADKIFQVFQRLHNEEQAEGVGIGLAVCQRIVEFHGGKIWLDTEYKGGARFKMLLPKV